MLVYFDVHAFVFICPWAWTSELLVQEHRSGCLDASPS
mgnify:CR=1 FL=1